MTLIDSEVSDIVRSVKAKLNPEDLKKLNDMVEKHVKKSLKQSGSTATSLSWRLTQRLKVVCAFCVRKLDPANISIKTKKEKSASDKYSFFKREKYDSAYGKSKPKYSKDAPFMRKAAKLPKCSVRVKRLQVKPGRRYDAKKYMKNLPRSRQEEVPKKTVEKDKHVDRKRKRIIDSSSSSSVSSASSSDEDEETIKVPKVSKPRKEEKMEVDSHEEAAIVALDASKKTTVVEEDDKPREKEEKAKTTDISSNLFDQMMKKEKEKAPDENVPKSAQSIEDIPKIKKATGDVSENRESSSKIKTEKDTDAKPVVKDLIVKHEKEKHKSSSSSSRDEKKSHSSKDDKKSDKKSSKDRQEGRHIFASSVPI